MSAYYQDERLALLHGDAIEQVRTLDDGSVQTVVTSPPYFGLRNYGEDGQYGAEDSPADFVARLVALFREIRRVLADDGTVWLNLGDSYNAHPGQRKVGDKAGAKQASKRGSTAAPSRSVDGLAAKNLIGIPWRVAFALQDDGWILRSDIIWHKPNAMPESVTDRPTNAHEHLFLFAKSPRYYYDAEAITEPISEATSADMARRKTLNNKGTLGGVRADLARSRSEYVRADGMRNRRNVWAVNTTAFSGAHFAVFPPALVRPCILAGSRPGDTVLDPFSGSGTTGMVALQEGRKYVGIDLNADYIDLSLRERFQQQPLDIFGSAS